MVQEQDCHQREIDFTANPKDTLSYKFQPQAWDLGRQHGWARPPQRPELFTADRKIAVVDISLQMPAHVP